MRALLTEKTLMRAKGSNQFTFLVDPGMTKNDIKKVVSETFGVHVTDVQTSNVQGKQKRVGKKRTLSRGSNFKKAVVTLKDKEKIDLFEIEEQGK